MNKFVMPTELARRIDELEGELRVFAQEARDAWESRSERWQESDAGCEVGAWLDALDHLGETLEYLDKEVAAK